ncbi:MAG: hypothetical protein ACYS0E_13125 [Planctomycetota bacterium]
MRNALGILLLLGAGCSSAGKIEVPDVAVTAAEESEGTRIQFQLNKGNVTAHDFHLKVETGKLKDICRSNDLRRVSVLWTREEGKITCAFPYGQTGEWETGGDLLKDHFTYVFLEAQRTSVKARLSRGAPMRPRLLLSVEIPKKELPAVLVWEGREPRHLVRETSLIIVAFPISDRRVLETGDWKVTLQTKSVKHEFLIGLDKDGTPTAANGYVQRAP